MIATTLRANSDGISTYSSDAFTTPPLAPTATPSKLVRANRRAAAAFVIRSTGCGCNAANCALSSMRESTGAGTLPPRPPPGGPPRPPPPACDATVGSFSATRCAVVRLSRSIVATAAASAKRLGAGAGPPRPPPNVCGTCGPPAPRLPACGNSTTNLPAACAIEICCVVSPAVPPKITSALAIARGARAPGMATTSTFHTMGLPSTVTRECSVNLRR